MRRSIRRAGITLTEVLVALFIMAIGMIALLVMFPLGAQQIAQAIKDERAAQAANNADNIFRDHWRQYVVNYLKAGGTEQSLVDPNPPNLNSLHYMTAMEAPGTAIISDIAPTNIQPTRNGQMPPLSAGWVTTPENRSRPSYPVFISPYNELARRGAGYVQSRRWVAGVHSTAALNATVAIPANLANTRVPRRTLNFPAIPAATFEAQNANWQFRYSTLADDLDFDEDGRGNVGTSVTRSGRYNWDWVVQRPNQANRLEMNLTIIVYDQRQFRNPRPDEETCYPVTYTVGSSTVAIPYDTTVNPPRIPPAIRAGQWVMDGTITGSANSAAPNLIRNAVFYRVTAVTDIPGATPGTGIVQIDLQNPIKDPAGVTIVPNAAGNKVYNGQLYVLRGVAEVFERRPVLNDDAPNVP